MATRGAHFEPTEKTYEKSFNGDKNPYKHEVVDASDDIEAAPDHQLKRALKNRHIAMSES